MKKTEHIWLVVDSSGFGGIESHIVELAVALKRGGLNTQVIVMQHRAGHPLYARLKANDIAYTALSGIVSFIAYSSRQRPTLIHTHGYKAGIVGRMLAKIMKLPCVSTFHAGEDLKGKLAVYDLLDRNTAFLADHVLAVSESIAKKISAPTEVINNFVDTTHATLSTGQQIAFIGRLSHEKGPDHYIALAQSHSDKVFHIYGDGPLAQVLRDDAPSNVRFHGQQSDMNAVWQNIGVLLITSRQEGLPMTALEAMARGVPVIAFNVGALSSLIGDKKNGWLVAPDDLVSMSNTLTTWLTLNNGERRCIQRAAIDKVEREFSNIALLPKYLRIYQDITQSLQFVT